MTPEEIQQLAQTLKILLEITADKPDEYLPLYAAIGGALVGAIASVFPTWVMERARYRNEARTVMNAIACEVTAIVNLTRQRRYLEDLEEIVTKLKKGLGTTGSYTVHIPEHYSRIYQNNLSKLGLLPPHFAKSVVLFYQLIDAVAYDVNPGRPLSDGQPVEAFEETITIFKQALELGHEIEKYV